jgi:hypothetical protein
MTLDDDLPPILTVEQTAKLLGISRGLAFTAARSGDIPSIRIGRRILRSGAGESQVEAVRLERAVDDDATTHVSRVAPRPASDDPTPRRPARRLTLAVLLILLCAAVAIVIARHAAPPARTMSVLPTTAPATTDVAFPSDTASDVVSYADHVALVTAIAETDAPPTATPVNSPGGEHVVMRTITFRVDRTLWSRPDAPTAPKQLTALWWGWLLRDSKRTPFIVHGAPAVFLGATYVMPIAYDGTAFSAIEPFAVFRVGRDGISLEEQDTPLALDLADAALDEISTVFASAEPDPVAAQYRHLLPRARLAAVLATRAR